MADQPMLDQSDTELLQSFAQLSPLLLQASQFLRTNEDELQTKKAKQKHHAGTDGRGHRATAAGAHESGEIDGPSGAAARQSASATTPTGMLRFVRPIQPRQCADGPDTADTGRPPRRSTRNGSTCAPTSSGA